MGKFDPRYFKQPEQPTAITFQGLDHLIKPKYVWPDGIMWCVSCAYMCTKRECVRMIYTGCMDYHCSKCGSLLLHVASDS